MPLSARLSKSTVRSSCGIHPFVEDKKLATIRVALDRPAGQIAPGDLRGSMSSIGRRHLDVLPECYARDMSC